MQLKCNDCRHFDDDTSVCKHLKEYLPNGYAKLYYGGAIGKHFGNAKHPGKCGLTYQARERLEIGLTSDGERDSILATVSRVKAKG